MGKMVGAVYAGLGLLMGVIFALFTIVASVIGAASAGSGEPLVGIAMGLGALVGMPLFYGLMGFVGGILTGAVYNFVAARMGGVELEWAEAG